MKESFKEKICLALDVASAKEAEYFVRTLSNYIGYFKIGLQLFCAEGPSIIETVVKSGGKVFLDLKLHDIPNTVAGAVHSMVSLGVSIIDVHIIGGSAMLRAAVDAAKDRSKELGMSSPKMIGVTVLTSIDVNLLKGELRVESSPKEYARHLALIARNCGLDGIVCSAEETKEIKQDLGKTFFVINPGIRPAWSMQKGDDQKRIATPRSAIEAGADLLVIGRPILTHPEPEKAIQNIIDELSAIDDK